jgi:hypothetical protein
LPDTDEGVGSRAKTRWPQASCRPSARGGQVRQVLVISLALLVAMAVGATTPALADPGVIKDVFIEDFQGSLPLDDPTFSECLGYEGQILRTATASTT